MASFTTRLDAALTFQGIPHFGLSQLAADDPSLIDPPPDWHLVARPDGIVVRIDYDNATVGQIARGDNLAMTMDASDHQTRRLTDIYTDVAALTAAQQANIWTDISAAVPGDVPRKYLADAGPNAASIFNMDYVLYVTAATGPKLTVGRNQLIAMYTQDNIYYLVHPPFDPSINVSGDEPV